MRGVVVFITGLFALAGITMFGAPLIDAIYDAVIGYEAVQQVGYDEQMEGIRDAVLRWTAILFIAFLLVSGFVWYLRFELWSGVQTR